ncbi:antiterminator Q family protein [Psychrobacter sp. BI730]|uniref:antiterminator Q family protein n=1 Tax=Psychrobacter sp. BI730 TaxID=2705463 RepID=UPI0015CD79C8|nr:antiterminator Q family protein [Psychrobacter sp. BI730]NYR09590.1 hypothetical protein [Psychrobacter sp. BI730]
MTDNIVELLEQWGAWSRSGLDNLSYKSNMESIMHKAPIVDVTTCRQYRSVAILNDDDAMRVNDVLIELRDDDVDAYNSVFLHYYLQQKPEYIAHNHFTVIKYGKDSKRKVSKHIVYQHLARAEGFVRYALKCEII